LKLTSFTADTLCLALLKLLNQGSYDEVAHGIDTEVNNFGLENLMEICEIQGFHGDEDSSTLSSV
jgi:hypothetical protein